jgi:hypothetical protein
MNEPQDTSAPPHKPGFMVRAFLIGLPVGLAFMVPISLWIYYQKKHRPAPATSQYAPILRKELNADDFMRYARILAQDIGERSLAQPDHLDAAVRFIESTMDFANMGYNVQRQNFEADGKPLVNLIAELPGRSRPDEIVWVVAGYDAADASGIAALMCVAHALTGTDHARTIRFAAVMQSAGGLTQLRKDDRPEQKPRTVIALAPTSSSVSGAAWAGAESIPFSISSSEASPLGRLRELQTLIEKSADQP